MTHDAEEAGAIRAALFRTGIPIGPYDILIAAQARCRSAILVTANIREFARVPALTVENWMAA
jgi:tRNA(fMet)-specific endonuclease VapC